MNEVQARTAAREAVRTGTVIGTATARALAHFWTDNNLSTVRALRAFAQGAEHRAIMRGMLREVEGLLAYIARDKGTEWENNRVELQALRDYAASVTA